MDFRKRFVFLSVTFVVSILFFAVTAYAKTDVPVFLLTGQSNMSGYASSNDLTNEQRQEVPNVKIYADMTWEGDDSKERKWLTLGPGFGSGAGKIGPELAMGRTMAEALPDTKIAFLKICCGSTYLGLLQSKANDCWVPPSSNNGNAGTHYRRMLESIETAMGKFNDAFDTSEYTPRWAGFVWLQGEFDGMDRGLADAYEENLSNLINDVRDDLEIDDLPFIIPMIDVQSSWQYNAQVRAAEIAVTTKFENVDTLDTRGFETDGAHYRAQGQEKIGTRTTERWMAMEYDYRTPVNIIATDFPAVAATRQYTGDVSNFAVFDLSGRKFARYETGLLHSLTGGIRIIRSKEGAMNRKISAVER